MTEPNEIIVDVATRYVRAREAWHSARTTLEIAQIDLSIAKTALDEAERELDAAVNPHAESETAD